MKFLNKNENNWIPLRRKHILKELVLKFKLTKLGWKIPCKILNYDVDEWYNFKEMTECFYF